MVVIGAVVTKLLEKCLARKRFPYLDDKQHVA